MGREFLLLPSSCFFHFLLPLYFIVSFSQQTNTVLLLLFFLCNSLSLILRVYHRHSNDAVSSPIPKPRLSGWFSSFIKSVFLCLFISLLLLTITRFLFLWFSVCTRFITLALSSDPSRVLLICFWCILKPILQFFKVLFSRVCAVVCFCHVFVHPWIVCLLESFRFPLAKFYGLSVFSFFFDKRVGLVFFFCVCFPFLGENGRKPHESTYVSS